MAKVNLIQGRKQNLTKVVIREKFGFITITAVDLEEVIKNISSEAGINEMKARFSKLEKHRLRDQVYDLIPTLKATECCEELHTYLRVSLKDIDRRLNNIKKLEVKKDKLNGVFYYGVALGDLVSTISYDEFSSTPSADIQEIFSADKNIQYKNWMCYSPKFKDYLLNEDGVDYFMTKSQHIDKTFQEEVVAEVKKKMYEVLPKLSIR